MSQRKQFYITSDQQRRLRATAQRLRCTEAEIVREAISRYFREGDRDADADSDPLFGIVGLTSGARTSSAEIDDVLYGKGGR